MLILVDASTRRQQPASLHAYRTLPPQLRACRDRRLPLSSARNPITRHVAWLSHRSGVASCLILACMYPPAAIAADAAGLGRFSPASPPQEAASPDAQECVLQALCSVTASCFRACGLTRLPLGERKCPAVRRLNRHVAYDYRPLLKHPSC